MAKTILAILMTVKLSLFNGVDQASYKLISPFTHKNQVNENE
ncbi:hypothetical protein [Bacillus andreraoultii]|nr:hypothetical protein [Bacillus andreraoultii]